MRSLFQIWTRPIHIETEIEGRKKFYTYTAQNDFVAKE